MSKSLGPERFAVGRTDRRAEVRIDVCIAARFCLANKRDANGNRRKFACRAINISQSAIALLTPIAGVIGERVITYFEEFGELNGAISRVFNGGLVITIVANKKGRAKLRNRLLSLKEHENLKVSDRRLHKRIVPQEPRSALILSDGRILECFVIDMSASGAAVSSDEIPTIGTPLAVGKVVGKVIRHFEDGFAVRFNEIQNLDRLEEMIVHNWSHEEVSAMPIPILLICDHEVDRLR
jgi:hypothetical protein